MLRPLACPSTHLPPSPTHLRRSPHPHCPQRQVQQPPVQPLLLSPVQANPHRHSLPLLQGRCHSPLPPVPLPGYHCCPPPHAQMLPAQPQGRSPLRPVRPVLLPVQMQAHSHQQAPNPAYLQNRLHRRPSLPASPPVLLPPVHLPKEEYLPRPQASLPAVRHLQTQASPARTAWQL